MTDEKLENFYKEKKLINLMLSNKYVFTGYIIELTDKFLILKDNRNVEVTINIDEIIFIKEVE